MVRSIRTFVLLVILLGLPSCSARMAYAEDGDEQQAQEIVVESDTSVIEEKLESIDSNIQTLVVFSEEDRIARETDAQLKDLKEDESSEDDSKELEALDRISVQLESISGQMAEQEPAKGLAMAAGASLTTNAYGNVSPTGTYAQYAARILPKLSYSDSYVFWQNGSSEYYMIWGDIEQSGTRFVGSDLEYAHWYYTSNTVGYVYETGTGSFNVNPGQYVVLTDLGDYPILDDGTVQFRNEVGLYVLVALVVFCLHHVWSFVIRLRYVPSS